jgi:hypothetical protein
MVSSDNVTLLRPARPGSSFPAGERAGPGSMAIQPGLVVATIYTLAAPAAEGFTDAFERVIVPELVAGGVRPFAMFETEPGPNSFPRLPVREGEHVFVWFARFTNVPAYERWKAGIAGSKRWAEVVRSVLDANLRSPVEIWPVEILRMVPTARSRPIG